MGEGWQGMILETRLYNLRNDVDTLIAIGRMHVEPDSGSSWFIVMNPVDYSPAFAHYRAELDTFDRIPGGWITARVRLVINADHYVQCPVSWWEHPTDIPTGVVRWLPYADEGTYLLTLKAES